MLLNFSAANLLFIFRECTFLLGICNKLNEYVIKLKIIIIIALKILNNIPMNANIIAVLLIYFILISYYIVINRVYIAIYTFITNNNLARLQLLIMRCISYKFLMLNFESLEYYNDF